MPSNPRWHQKPPIGTPIDQANPLADGLVAFWPMQEGGGKPYDIVTGRQVATRSSPWAGTPLGAGLTTESGQFIGLGSGPSYLNVTGPITLAALARCAQSNLQTLFDFGGSSGAECELTLNQFGGNGLVYGCASINYSTLNGPTMAGAPHTFAVSQSGTGSNQVEFFVDGVRTGTASAPSIRTVLPA